MIETAVKERPILFRGKMVRAILEGRKTQTRRVVKRALWETIVGTGILTPIIESCPHGQPGDRLWVRENWMDLRGTGIEHPSGSHPDYAYQADTPPGSEGDAVRKDYGLKWKPSIHMPRWASRLTLEIVNVRVERVQEISDEDCIKEGIEPVETREQTSERNRFEILWDTMRAGTEFAWDKNPWVWVIEFKKL